MLKAKKKDAGLAPEKAKKKDTGLALEKVQKMVQ